MASSEDSLFALAQRAAALQPAAEAVIQSCRVARGRPVGEQAAKPLVDDARRVAAGFRRLRDELERLGAGGPDTDELAGLLDQHGDLVTAALRSALDRTAAEPAPDGLGRPAARLVAIRDRLRNATRVAGRRVEDLPTSERF